MDERARRQKRRGWGEGKDEARVIKFSSPLLESGALGIRLHRAGVFFVTKRGYFDAGGGGEGGRGGGGEVRSTTVHRFWWGGVGISYRVLIVCEPGAEPTHG